MHADQMQERSECCSNPSSWYQTSTAHTKAHVDVHPILRRSRSFSEAITCDRNANSATKGRDLTRLRREGGHTDAYRIEGNAIRSLDPNNIHQQDI